MLISLHTQVVHKALNVLSTEAAKVEQVCNEHVQT